MQSKQYFTKIKNYPHEKSTEPKTVVIRLTDRHNRKDEMLSPTNETT